MLSAPLAVLEKKWAQPPGWARNPAVKETSQGRGEDRRKVQSRRVGGGGLPSKVAHGSGSLACEKTCWISSGRPERRRLARLPEMVLELRSLFHRDQRADNEQENLTVDGVDVPAQFRLIMDAGQFTNLGVDVAKGQGFWVAHVRRLVEEGNLGQALLRQITYMLCTRSSPCSYA